jgi:plasmid stabilization system protein ParE
MTRKLIVRPRAEIDRASHFLYLSDRSPQAASRFDQAVSEAFKRIKADSQPGTRLNLPQLGDRDFRFYRPKGFEKYIIVFRLAEDVIYVSRILHSAQDIETAVLDQ